MMFTVISQFAPCIDLHDGFLNEVSMFLFASVPGVLVCWLYVRNKNSWLHTCIGILLGTVSAYGGLYVFSQLKVAHFDELAYVLGPSAARELTNRLAIDALKTSVAVIVGVAVLWKTQKGKPSSQ